MFIVLEGSDGSGKGTQFRLLAERLKAVGHEIAVFDFPRYDEPSSHFVKKYLNGEYGPASEVSPYIASIFYALDRYEASPQINKALKEGKIVLANRYAGSNMAHQGAKFTSLAEQRGFFMWADSLEYEMFKIPRPNLNLFLKVPPEISYELVAKKQKRSYTKQKRDQHEADIDHIHRSSAAYDLLCKLLPKDFKEIKCTSGNKLLSVIEINDLIWDAIKTLLPPPKRPGKSITLLVDERKNTQKPTTKIMPININKKKKGTPAQSKIDELRSKILAIAAKSKHIDRVVLRAATGALKPVNDNPRLEQLINAMKQQKPIKKDTTLEPQPLQRIINELATEHLPNAATTDQVILVKRTPLNEFAMINGDIESLSYADKERRFKESLTRNNGELLKKISYRFEIISSLQMLDYLLTKGIAEDIKLKNVGPRLGYEIPQFIEETNLDRDFRDCFTQAEENNLLLFGHRARWEFTINAKLLKQAKRIKHNTEFFDRLIELVEEYHPLTAGMIKSILFAKNN